VLRRDRFGSATGRRLVFLDSGEVTEDLVRDMVEVFDLILCAVVWGSLGP
jgi:predicted site-specific integrase-resolvase